MIRFLHASDLYLGKPFGGFPEEVRHRLRQARRDAIGALARAVRDGGASHVLLASDTFDAETATRATLRQAMNAMAGHDDLTWVLRGAEIEANAAEEARLLYVALTRAKSRLVFHLGDREFA